jgi:Protein of unknown function (DUF3429)
MEFSALGGRKGHARYLVGSIPLLLAWPTLLVPGELGLAAQWAAFTAVWFIDLKTTGWGWSESPIDGLREILNSTLTLPC